MILIFIFSGAILNILGLFLFSVVKRIKDKITKYMFIILAIIAILLGTAFIVKAANNTSSVIINDIYNLI